jgi:hypothetical protein
LLKKKQKRKWLILTNFQYLRKRKFSIDSGTHINILAWFPQGTLCRIHVFECDKPKTPRLPSSFVSDDSSLLDFTKLFKGLFRESKLNEMIEKVKEQAHENCFADGSDREVSLM